MKSASHRRTNTARFHLYEVSRTVKFIETESRRVVAKGWGEEEMGSCSSMGVEFQLCKRNKF